MPGDSYFVGISYLSTTRLDVPYLPDGLHPTQEGQDALGRAVVRGLQACHLLQLRQ